MRTILPAALAALCLAASAARADAAAATSGAPSLAPSAAAARDRVDLWLDPLRGRRSYAPGDVVRLDLNTDGRAYVAVVHLDPAGRVELLWPRSPYDRGEVRGRRRIGLSLGRVSERWWDDGGPRPWEPRRDGRDDRWDDGEDGRWEGRRHRDDDPRDGWGRGRERGGIGYVLAIASDEPLDVGRFRDRMGWRRDLRVAGDPYRALRRVSRGLLRGDVDDLRATDLYTYRVGRAGRFPGYACYDDWSSWDRRGQARWRGCDALERRLGREPDYFDWRVEPRRAGAAPQARARLFSSPEARAEMRSAPSDEREEGGERRDRPRVVAPAAGRPR